MDTSCDKLERFHPWRREHGNEMENLKREAESLVKTAWNYVTRTNFIKTKINYMNRIASVGYVKQTANLHKRNKNLVRMVILWELSWIFKFDHTTKWHMQRPASFQEIETHKILTDFDIQTDHLIPVGRADQVLINNKKRTCHLVNFVVPDYHWVKIKENDKMDKYLDFVWEMKKQWNLKVTVIPVVFVEHGTVPRDLDKRPGGIRHQRKNLGWCVLHLMTTPAQQSSLATVSPMPVIKGTSTTSYLPLSDKFPNTTFYSSVETWMLKQVKTKIRNSAYITRQTEMGNIKQTIHTKTDLNTKFPKKGGKTMDLHLSK